MHMCADAVPFRQECNSSGQTPRQTYSRRGCSKALKIRLIQRLFELALEVGCGKREIRPDESRVCRFHPLTLLTSQIPPLVIFTAKQRQYREREHHEVS
jgi:hypothetical protein